MQTLKFDGYIGRFASPTKEGVDEVFDFLNAAGRSPQVYARLYEKVEESVLAGLFWGVWRVLKNHRPQLVSTSAIFLHGKDQIAISEDSTENHEIGTYVEHGATLRRKDLEGVAHPKGVFLQILMAAPLVQLFCLAGQNITSLNGRLFADIVIDNVQQGAQSDYVRNFIRSEPHNWEEIVHPSLHLLSRFESSVDDPNVNRAKDFNRFFVRAIPAMAEIVYNALATGSLKAIYRETQYEAKIDLDALPLFLKETLPTIIENKSFFEELDKATSFAKARYEFDQHLNKAKYKTLSRGLVGEGLRTYEMRLAQSCCL